jgi:uncharacterized RDD family membrane protein YckC
MSRAAQFEDGAETYLATGTEGGGKLQQLAAERLAAHRRRRAVIEGRAARARREAAGLPPEPEAADLQPDAVRVRDAVVARYRESQSYREFLAEEAQRAMERAQAEAEVAARNAIAVAQARRELLREIEQWRKDEQRRQPELVEAAAQRGPLQVRMHEPLGAATAQGRAYVPAQASVHAAEELAKLDEEIEFRLAPGFEEFDVEVQSIQGNIIEFPRQLVATRKMRPRLAEGPLLEETKPEPQLRIFEVEPEQIAVEPEIVIAAEPPEWQSLRLGSEAFAVVAAQVAVDHALHVATVGRRMASVAVDGALLAGGVAGAAEVAAKAAGPVLRGAPLLSLAIAAAGMLVVFAVLYRLLFFTLNTATPGMRAARLAFCTFDEQSPTRKAVRRRMFATLLAICPLGLGLVWMVLDSDRLGWHDRMSRMYPRKY